MPEQHHVANSGRPSQALYSREMPGGGSVRVEILVDDHGNIAGERVSGRVVMQRRHGVDSDTLVVVEELEGNDPDDVVPELLRIARDNAAIARRVLRQRAVRRAD